MPAATTALKLKKVLVILERPFPGKYIACAYPELVSGEVLDTAGLTFHVDVRKRKVYLPYTQLRHPITGELVKVGPIEHAITPLPAYVHRITEDDIRRVVQRLAEGIYCQKFHIC